MSEKNKKKVICGIQQVGIGVSDVYEAWNWYKKYMGFNARIVDDQGVAERMLPYTGGKPQPRHAVLVMNLRGGGGLEIWQPQQRSLNYLSYQPELGDLGIFACKIKTKDVKSSHAFFKGQGLNVISEIQKSPAGDAHFFMRDPYGNLLDVEQDGYVLFDEDKLTGGNNGVIIGVSDMDRSIRFYGKIAEYDRIEYDKTGVFPDLQSIPGSSCKVRRVLLSRSKPIEGPLSKVYGTSHLELVQRIVGPGTPAPHKLYEGRFWGDPGFIHLCFDVRNMDEVHKDCLAVGHEFVCDGGRDFKMGEADGHFTYIEDPDGTLIEFVETFKIPVLKKLGIYLHLDHRSDTAPLPWYIHRGLRFLETK